MDSFSNRLQQRIRTLDTRVCLGIDPRPERHPSTHPDTHGNDPATVARAVVTYFRETLETTAELVACVKLQSAFFERLGIPGLIAMAQLLADVKNLGIPVILDAKRGDIGETAGAYADAYLGEGVFNADALTVNPYLGRDALAPFAKAATERGRAIFVLVKTSNPGSADLQDLDVSGTRRPLWQHTADLVAGLAREHASEAGFGPVGAVVGGTHPNDLATARRMLPHSLFLVPGFGAQGASANDVVAAFTTEGLGAVVNASRSLTYVTSAGDFADAAATAARTMRDDINAAIGASNS